MPNPIQEDHMNSKRNPSGANTRQPRAWIFRSFTHKARATQRGLQATGVMLALIAFVFIQGATGKAQSQKPTPEPESPASKPVPEESPAASPAATPPSLRDIVEVTNVYNLQYATSTDKDWKGILEKAKAGLGDIIIIEVKSLEALLLKSKCQKPYDQDCLPKDIILYLDGRPFKGLLPESGAPTLEPPKAGNAAEAAQSPPAFLNGKLRYHLQRDTAACANDEGCKEYWADLLGFSTNPAQWSLKRRVEVSVGLTDEYPVRTQVKPDGVEFFLIRIRPYRLPFWIIFTLLCGILLIWLAKRHGLLSDRAPVLWGQRKPYSLSACQIACWFMVILVSFVFIWLVTGQYDFSSTALILLGIGSGTALTATMMDSSTRTESSQPQIESTELNRLLSDKEKLERELNNLVPTRASKEVSDLKAEYSAKIEEIKQKFPKAIGPPAERFLIDILSDASGVNFHRFQMLIWTIVLSVFFLISVLGMLSIPDFSTTLLLLMGLSAGTYLGFKVNENNNLPASAGTPSATPVPPAPPPGDEGGDDVTDHENGTTTNGNTGNQT
jgi:hypothetical protein